MSVQIYTRELPSENIPPTQIEIPSIIASVRTRKKGRLLTGHSLKRAGIVRVGFEYQDLIGIELLIEFFRNPDLYEWVELESEDKNVGHLDDVVAARSDGTFELIQVKFTVNPSEYFLDWDWLLDKKPKGTSLLTKWAKSLRKVAQLGTVRSARLRTNRRPDAEIADALKGRFLDLELVSSERRRAIETELGGSASAKEFFADFEFSHSEPLFDDLETQLMRLIVPTDTDSSGWLLLREQARGWATKKYQPEPDGRIRQEHLIQIITKKRTQPIPQNFQIPEVYSVPSFEFHAEFMERIKKLGVSISVLWGSPGRGKSTYLSFVAEELKKDDLPIIRHHYFLSLDDTTSDRVSFPEIATSLMDQMNVRYPEAVRDLDYESNKLRTWIEACGSHFAKRGKRFLIIIDGLDHVWREQVNTAQMDQLFNYVLPCPANVSLLVGTQRVPENQLPYRLIQNASVDDWIEIPAMDERAVQEWITGQNDAGRVRLHDRQRPPKPRDEELGAIGSAFFEISQGHPLHLIYSFEALVRRGAVFTPNEIRLLPACPDGDIRRYYNGLWGRLSANAKQIVHLIAGSDFHWPALGIRQCAGPIDEIDHMLEHRRSGLIPFHGSVLAYARDRSDHEVSFRSLLPKVVEWLERDAPDYWHWGWLWLMRAKNGDHNDLLQGTTRAWVIESLTRGWPDQQIVTILSEAERKAFENMDYSRTIELRSLKTRVQNGPEFQMNSFSQFQENAIRVHGNTQQIFNMADRIATLSEDQIVTLARASTDDEFDIRSSCLKELRSRVNLWLSLRHRPGAEFMSLAKNFVEVLALEPSINVRSVINFFEGFHEPDEMFGWLLNCLTRQMCFGTLAEIADNLKSAKKKHWRLSTQNAMVRAASLEGINIESRFRSGRSHVSPLMACWLHYHKALGRPRVAKPVIPKNVVRDSYPYGRNSDLEAFFHVAFFGAFASAVTGGGNFSVLSPDQRNETSEWIFDAVRLLENTARRIAKGHTQLSFSTPYEAAREIKPVVDRAPYDAKRAQYHSFKYALRQIAIDLHCVKSPTGKTPLVRKDELATVRMSPHWSDEVWITEEVESRFHLLTLEAANQILEEAIDGENGRITEFNERADKWTELASFALLYEIPRAAELLSRAADCLAGYGWRKDLWIIDVLDAVAEVHEYGAADGLPQLRLLVPIVEQITKFTDGDETDHARSALIDTIARVCPVRLPDFYAHHIAQGEFR